MEILVKNIFDCSTYFIERSNTKTPGAHASLDGCCAPKKRLRARGSLLKSQGRRRQRWSGGSYVHNPKSITYYPCLCITCLKKNPCTAEEKCACEAHLLNSTLCFDKNNFILCPTKRMHLHCIVLFFEVLVTSLYKILTM